MPASSSRFAPSKDDADDDSEHERLVQLRVHAATNVPKVIDMS